MEILQKAGIQEEQMEEKNDDNDVNTYDAVMESWKIEYWEIVAAIRECIRHINDKTRPRRVKRDAAYALRKLLNECCDDENLSDLTSIYRNEIKNSALGYDTDAIIQFLTRMSARYPKPKS